MKKKMFFTVIFFLSVKGMASDNYEDTDEKYEYLDKLSNDLALSKYCSYHMDEFGQEDMAIFFSKMYIERINLKKALKEEDRKHVTFKERFLVGKMDSIATKETWKNCEVAYNERASWRADNQSIQGTAYYKHLFVRSLRSHYCTKKCL